jgi:deoxyribodipyrimidine photo-lyase
VSGGPGLVWFRRDLRLDQNPAWAAATSRHDDVVAVFVLEEQLMASGAATRRNLLLGHLRALDADLREHGGSLTVVDGPATQAIPDAVDALGATAVHANADVSPFACRRDDDVADALTVPIHWQHGLFVHRPGTVLTKDGHVSKVFTPFYKAWAATDREPWPDPGDATVLDVASDIASVDLPEAGDPPMEPGAAAAWQRVEAWLERVDDYGDTRDRIDPESTSRLSADLRFGTLSPRELVDAVGDGTPGREAFVRQLSWRDWWAHSMWERPELTERAAKPQYDRIEWRRADDDFEAWADGRTGFPIVDAGMRQLVATGWMHNRVRMVCASFLVKDLLIDWRRGERFFRRHLLDGDPAQNAGNWQWVAGTGPDAAPYFRVFNPIAQSRQHDPDGSFIKRWVPELAELDDDIVHEPSAAPAIVAAAGIELGTDYPHPIVDHAAARQRALDAYKAATG